MNTAKTILVLGGGIGGVVVASRLRKGLSSEHRVVLIEREPDYVFAPSFLWLMTGLRQHVCRGSGSISSGAVNGGSQRHWLLPGA